MQQLNKKQGTDVIQELIEDSLMAFPVSRLVISLYKQYAERGFLTKKQLQALYNKASTIAGINTARLATLEAIIKKMPNRFKSDKPIVNEMIGRDEESEKIIEAILLKFPEHKRVLFLKSKLEHEKELTITEKTELIRFQKALKNLP